jgi:hypothetical protein
MKFFKKIVAITIATSFSFSAYSGILQEAKKNAKNESEFKEVESFSGKKNVLLFLGQKENSQGALTVKLPESIKGGSSLEFDFDFQKTGGEGKQDFLEIQTKFWDANGRRIKERPQVFRIYKNSSEWKKASQEIYVPENAGKGELLFLFKGKIKFYISSLRFVDGAMVKLKKSKGKHILFYEDFESFPAIFANGGRLSFPFDSTLAASKMEIVEGKFGNALKIKNNSPGEGIVYSPKGKINANEGTIEFWQKVIYKDIDKYPERGLVAFWLNGIGNESNRIQIFSGFGGKKVFGVRFSGNSPSFFTPYGESANTWKHVAVTWKANRGVKKDEFQIYIDGQKVKKITGVTINFDQEKIDGKAKMTIGGSYKAHGECIIIDKLKIWDKAMDISIDEN